MDVHGEKIAVLRVAMSTRIDIKGLARFETGEDGASISLVAEDVSGSSVVLTFRSMSSAVSS